MTNIIIYRNQNGEICGFKAEDHGDPIVCAAISMLTFNAVNSVESFTDEHLVCEYDENGGFLYFELPDIKNGGHNGDVKLLMDSMLLGLKSIENDYEHVKIFDE